MTRHWTELEDLTLSERYRLKRCLCSTPEDAWYLTRLDAASDAAVRVMRADLPEAPRQLEIWRETLNLGHPHIVFALDAGRAEIQGTDLVYLVCECPDDFLASAIAGRPLSSIEAREVLSACVSALAFLHAQGLVHGSVDPAHIASVRDQIKLTSDTIRPAGTSGVPAEPTGEAFTAAADVWALGATLVEILTRERPVPGGEIPDLPEPFATIVHHTCTREPAERWSVQDIEAHLHAPAAAGQARPRPAPDVEAPLPPPPEAREVRSAVPLDAPSKRVDTPARRGAPFKWVPAVGLLAALVLGIVLWRHPQESVARPAVQTAPAAAPSPPPAPVRLPWPTPQSPQEQARANPSATWRVVAYEYSTRPAAEKAARRINAKRPAWRAEVFAPRPDQRPYFVSLGGRLTLPEAERLRKEARAKGLPRDTFIRNFSQ